MKLLLLLSSLFLYSLIGFTQCPSGGVTFNSQQDVDDFLVNYPNCTTISGYVRIGDFSYPYNTTDITNIDALINITSITGYIDLSHNNYLTNLSGLGNLTSVGGDLTFAHLGISDFSDLGISNSSCGNLIIEYNDSLKTLDGFQSLTNIHGDLHIRHNQTLDSLLGLENITAVDSNLNIYTNNSLLSLSSLSSISAVGRDISIGNNDNITTLNGLESITVVGEDLSIYENNNLESLVGLDNIITIGGYLGIENNNSLLNISSLGNLNAVGDFAGYSISIYQNPVLTSLVGLENITTVPGDFTISGNSSLASLNGINSISTIEGSISIVGNSKLVNLNGLNSISTIGGEFRIQNSDSLTSLIGLDNLNSVNSLRIGTNISLNSIASLSSLDSIPNFVDIWENPTLSNLEGLNNIVSIGGFLFIENNTSLTTLSELANLTTIGEHLTIYLNHNLTSLTGLDNLSTIGEHLTINQNYNLTSLNSLDSLTYIGEELEIQHNFKLQTLDGLEKLSFIGGYFSLFDNIELTNLSGLENLISIGGFLEIAYHNKLNNISGIRNIDPTTINETSSYFNGDDLTIKHNPLLTLCDIQSICGFLELADSNLYLTSDIADNDIGCNSELEINSYCAGLLSDCPRPTSLDITNIAAFSADISWTPGDSCTVGDEYWVLTSPSSAPSIGSGVSTTCTPSFPITISALLAKQEYDIWIYEDCSNGNMIGPRKMGSFMTLDKCYPDSNFSLEFDGFDDYGYIPHSPDLLIGSNPYTLETWFKAPDEDQLGTIIIKRLATAPYTNVGFIINDGSNPRFTPFAGKKISFYFGHGEAGEDFRCVTTINDVIDGQFHHLAAVVDPAQNSIILYVDGIAVSTNLISTGTFPVINITNQYTIGNDNGGTAFYNGAIDEVRIWNVARPQSEIQNFMNIELAGTETGLVAYYPMNDGGESYISTDLVALNNCNLIDMYPFQDWICGVPGIAPLSCPPPNNFQSTNITETTAEITWTQGDSCTVGEEYWVLLSPSSSPLVGSGSTIGCSTSFPINLTGLTDNQEYDVWVFEDCGNGNTAGPVLAGSFTTLIACPPPNNLIVSNITEFTADISWSVGNSCSTNEEYWVENSPSSTPIIGTGTSLSCSPSFPITVLGLIENQEYDVWVYEDCGNGNNAGPLKLGSFETTQVCSPLGNYGLDFDGIDDYLNISTITGNNTASVEFWFNATTISEDVSLIEVRDDIGYNNEFELWFRNGGLELWNSPNGWVQLVPSVSIGSWHHLAISRISPTEIKTYYNGVLVSTNPVNTTVNFNNQRIAKNHAGAGNLYYNGKIDEFRVWDGPLSASDVQNRMNLELLGNESNLVAYYNFNDGAGSSLALDLSTNNNDGVLTNMDNITDWVCGKPGLAGLSCPSPSNLTIENIAENTAEISWAPGDSCSIGEEYWVLASPSTGPSIGTGTATNCTPSFPIILTGLNSNQEYDVWIYEDCGSGNTVGPLNLGFFTTPEVCNPSGNYALDFDGIDDYLDISTVNGNNETSIEFWFNAASISQNVSLIEVRDDIVYNNEFELWFRNGGLELWNYPNGWIQLVPSVSNENWHHLAISRISPTEIKTYYDGTLASTNTVNSTVNFKNQRIAKNHNSAGNPYYNGKIDEFRVWNGPLSHSEIQNRMNIQLLGNETNLVAYYNFNDGSGSFISTDITTNNYNGILNNMDITSDWICGYPGLGPSCYQYYYQDSDGDGYGVNSMDSLACTQPIGYSIENSDCDDTNPNIHPFADELCNGIDDNCDNVLDNPMVPYYNNDTTIISSISTDSVVVPLLINGAIDPITNVRILNLDINHSRISDLEVRLKSPMGTEIILLSSICEIDSNLLINLDDHAIEKIITCPPTSNGFFGPQGYFSDFYGENPNGIWILTIIDNLSSSGGKINGWGLDITRDCACNIVVSTIDSLAGSIIDALNCTNPGDTIIFSSQIFGDTINLNNYPIIIDKDISIIGPPFMQINISGDSTQFVMDINDFNAVVLLEQLNIIAGLSATGSGIRNVGILALDNVNVEHHSQTGTTSLIINNFPGQLIIRSQGTVKIFD